MEKKIISKRTFLILSILCMAPGLLFFIRVFVLGFGQELPIERSILRTLAIVTLIACTACVLVAYYFFRKKFFPKVG